MDRDYPDKRVVLVMDNLNTHTPASLYEAFGPAEARRIAKRLEIHHTPKQRAIWHKGWKAVTFHHRGTSFDDDVWEPYHLDADLAEIDNLADEHPDKLKELIDLCAQGTIIADGGRLGGWSVFILGNRLHYTTTDFGERCRVSSPVAIPPGAATVRADVVRTGTDEGRLRFYIQGEPARDGVLSPFRYHNFVNEPWTSVATAKRRSTTPASRRSSSRAGSSMS